MTENEKYKAYPVRRGLDYASWIGQVVLIQVTDKHGVIVASAGTLRSIEDRQARRPVPGKRGSEVQIVLESSAFLLEQEHVVNVWHFGEDATAATIQRVVTS